MKKPLGVYLAGRISDPNPIQFLRNIRAGVEESAKILCEGDYVFSPFCDYPLFGSKYDPTLEQVQQNSLHWMEKSDEVRVLPGYEKSKGTLREIEVARRLNILIVYL